MAQDDPTSPTAHQEGSMTDRLDRLSSDLQKSLLSLENNMNQRLDEMQEVKAMLNFLCSQSGNKDLETTPSVPVGFSPISSDPTLDAPEKARAEGLVARTSETPQIQIPTVQVSTYPDPKALETTVVSPPTSKPSVRDVTILISTTVTDSNMSPVEMTSWRSKESGLCESESATMGARVQNTARTRYPKKLISRSYHKARKKGTDISGVLGFEVSAHSAKKLMDVNVVGMKRRFECSKKATRLKMVQAFMNYGMCFGFPGFRARTRDRKEIMQGRLPKQTVNEAGMKNGFHTFVHGTHSLEFSLCVMDLSGGHGSSEVVSDLTYGLSSNKGSENEQKQKAPSGHSASKTAITEAITGDYSEETAPYYQQRVWIVCLWDPGGELWCFCGLEGKFWYWAESDKVLQRREFLMWNLELESLCCKRIDQHHELSAILEDSRLFYGDIIHRNEETMWITIVDYASNKTHPSFDPGGLWLVQVHWDLIGRVNREGSEEWLIAWIVSNIHVCTRMIARLFASEMLCVPRLLELFLKEVSYGHWSLTEGQKQQGGYARTVQGMVMIHCTQEIKEQSAGMILSDSLFVLDIWLNPYCKPRGEQRELQETTYFGQWIGKLGSTQTYERYGVEYSISQQQSPLYGQHSFKWLHSPRPLESLFRYDRGLFLGYANATEYKLLIQVRMVSKFSTYLQVSVSAVVCFIQP